ncbi:MAG: hypothetical protein JXX29_01585 [Deltaproteobacteria bacterium]|nr:hypothetical protein [Deltaproteobacteria bacterium]MBN2670331.1 hypothetical protein [Deltaproteobacteria bacterium]
MNEFCFASNGLLVFIAAMTKQDTTAAVVKNTGMGVIYITFAKLWFMMMGWVLVFVLPRLFNWAAGGDEDAGKAMYGVYGLVVTGVSFINNGIVTGTIQSVSKFTAEDESVAASVRISALKIMGAVGLIVAGVYALLSDVISTYWFESTDGHLARYMQLSAVIIVAYASYSVFIGSLNGLRRFRAQALFDISYTTIKTALMVGFVLAGFEVLGTVLGFICAALVICLAAYVKTRNTPGTASFEGKKFVSFAWVIIAYTFILNLVMMVDIYVLSGAVPRLAREAGMVGDAIQETMKIRAGQYKAVQQLAFIPYQAVIAIAFVVFPLVSKVAKDAEIEVAKRYISKALRFTLILIVGLASVFCGVAEGAMSLVFPDGYEVAAPALQVLSVGIVAFGLLVITNTVLNAAGKKWHAMTTVLIGMVGVLGLDALFLSFADCPGEHVLFLTAVGTSIAMFVTLAVSLFFVFRTFGAMVPLFTLFRVVAASATAVVAVHYAPGSGAVATLAHCVGVLVIYFGILSVTREFTGEDLGQLRQILKRNK